MKYFTSATVLLGISAWGVRAQQPLYAQCGGIGWSGGSACVSGASCNKLNDYYSQCLPGAAAPSSTSTASAPSGSSTPAPSGGITSFLGGVNMAGYDFSSKTDGSFENDSADPPTGQFSHFAAQGVNIFRIPFAWQLMTPTVGGTIDPQFFSRYDATVQTALRQSSSPFVILDVHNYARWNGAIIAQGGPTNQQFASLWSQLATKYKDNSKIIFGIMNEPHDVPSVATWATSVQAAVNAIRAAGATSQFILIPGSSWSSAEALPTEAGPALLGVTDPIGGKSKLIFDVHKYLDSDNSGTHIECSTNNIQVFTNLVTFLQNNGNRQALLSETGGGNTASCETAVNQELAFVKSHFPTLAGFTVWSAGSFDTTYELTVTPNPDGTDQPVWVAGVRPNLP